MITKETIDRIFDAARIEDVVGDFVQLKKRGVNLIGLCPFHNEKTPSFNVSPVRNIYKCFGCGKGGNAVNFIMEHEHYSYPEALRYLANKYSIEIEETAPDPRELEMKDEKESLYVLNTFAQKYFSENLFETEEGKSIGLTYFKERGFTEDIIRTFQLGYSQSGWTSFSDEAVSKGYQREYLLKTGLSVLKSSDKEGEQALLDRFRGRVMFPVHNLSGRIIAFGGRILKKDEKAAKYVNSPESDIYHKSRSLYGIYFAKKAIVQRDNCYLVEGYTDVISLHQSGIENVVASSGTSLTIEQIRLIGRYTKNITVLYDGDAAGIKASLRGIDLILEEGLNVKVVLFPDGDDPDSYRRKHGSSVLVDFIQQNSKDFVVFKTGLLLNDVADDPAKKSALIKEIVETISLIPDPITRSLYIKQCSALINMSEQLLIAEMNKQRQRHLGKNMSSEEVGSIMPETAILHAQQENIDQVAVQEKNIIRLLLNYGNNELHLPFEVEAPDEPKGKKELIEKVKVFKFIVREITHDGIEFENEIFNDILSQYAKLSEQSDECSPAPFLNAQNPEISSIAVELMSIRYFLSENWEQMHRITVPDEINVLQDSVERAVLYLKKKKVMKMLDESMNKIKEAHIKGEDFTALMEEHKQLEQLKVDITKGALGIDILR